MNDYNNSLRPKELDPQHIAELFIRRLYRLSGKINERVYTHSRHLIRSSLSNKLASLINKGYQRKMLMLEILQNIPVFLSVSKLVIDPL
jgi:hypothetical protein